MARVLAASESVFSPQPPTTPLQSLPPLPSPLSPGLVHEWGLGAWGQRGKSCMYLILCTASKGWWVSEGGGRCRALWFCGGEQALSVGFATPPTSVVGPVIVGVSVCIGAAACGYWLERQRWVWWVVPQPGVVPQAFGCVGGGRVGTVG